MLLSATMLYMSAANPASLNTKEREIDCLAKTIYHEARGESERGRKAVAMVTINRVNNPKFPNSICRVVHQLRQFSWTLNKKLKVREVETFKKIREMSATIYEEYHVKKKIPKSLTPLKGALFFTTKRVKGKFSKIGKHRFYPVRSES